MFTGLIEAIGVVKAVRPNSSAAMLSIDIGSLAEDVKIGDSIAINGICLTAAAIDKTIVQFDVSPETLAASSIKTLKTNSAVNIERAMKLSDRFGGHFVQGHVDASVKVQNITDSGKFKIMSLSCHKELLAQLLPKGSVAINGISLTISEINPTSFGVCLIPETIKNTTLKNTKTGDIVNIEIDIITKTVASQLANMVSTNSLTAEKIRQLGF